MFDSNWIDLLLFVHVTYIMRRGRTSNNGSHGAATLRNTNVRSSSPLFEHQRHGIRRMVDYRLAIEVECMWTGASKTALCQIDGHLSAFLSEPDKPETIKNTEETGIIGQRQKKLTKA